MINYNPETGTPFPRQRFAPGASGDRDFLSEYLWGLNSPTTGRFQQLGPDLAQVKLQQSLQAMYIQAQQQLFLLHQQLQLQIAQNPLGAAPLLSQFHQEAQQLLQATQYQAQQHVFSVLAQTYPQQKLRAQQPWSKQLSDEETEAVISQALEANPLTATSDITVESKDQVVTLHGVTSQRTAKWMAEMIAWSIPGVKDVTNSIELRGRHARQETNGRLKRETVKSG